MKIEHTAFNVKDAQAMAEWYVQNLGMRIVMQLNEDPYTHFLADESGNMIEIYSNSAAEIPDYEHMHHLILHLAFVSENPDADRARLEQKGATFIEDIKTPDGSHLLMMRDPFGLAIQFCKRAKSFM